MWQYGALCCLRRKWHRLHKRVRFYHNNTEETATHFGLLLRTQHKHNAVSAHTIQPRIPATQSQQSDTRSPMIRKGRESYRRTTDKERGVNAKKNLTKPHHVQTPLLNSSAASRKPRLRSQGKNPREEQDSYKRRESRTRKDTGKHKQRAGAMNAKSLILKC
ncbi:hypothetical protein TGPRC2_359000 [Toxoplasma gondii TgCatPRC2]|uniref:Uncharacterized protein n=1 Tax=Toxoplasma gondii TgCatPRC2 TaxID=1130821 RepID=A0A151HG06_TOXGO|nr:hypothetical protein TGPRC2_359000 [Toxoplasma gondii TgCatPRC2]